MAGGLLAAVLAADAVVLAVGVDEDLYYRASGPSADVGLVVEQPRVLPADLDALFPSVDGWERLDVPGQTGALSLDALSRRLYDSEADAARGRARLVELGFVRAHAAWWRDPATGDVVGIEVYELGSPRQAEEWVDSQELALSLEHPDAVVDVSYVSDEAASALPLDDGTPSLELTRRVGQAVVVEYVVGANADEERLRPLHDAFAGGFG